MFQLHILIANPSCHLIQVGIGYHIEYNHFYIGIGYFSIRN